MLYNCKKDYVDAEEAYRTALKYNPEDTKTWNNLGLLLEIIKKDYVGAEEAYKIALKYNPDYDLAKKNLKHVQEKITKKTNNKS